jgi:hypothetical protein
MKSHLDLKSFESYKSSSLKVIKEKLIEFYSEKSFSELNVGDIKKDIVALNAYPGIENMKEVTHSDIVVIDEDADTTRAVKAVLDGKIFWEHAAAGEATRLGMGTKYCIDPSTISVDMIKDLLVNECVKEGKSESDIKVFCFFIT